MNGFPLRVVSVEFGSKSRLRFHTGGAAKIRVFEDKRPPSCALSPREKERFHTRPGAPVTSKLMDLISRIRVPGMTTVSQPVTGRTPGVGREMDLEGVG